MSSSAGRTGQSQSQAQGQGQQYYAERYPQTAYEPRERDSGAGAFAGSLLAGALMIMSGLFGFLNGLAMVVRRTFFTNPANYPYHWSTTSWGWLELVLGAVIFAAGFCVILGMVWARVVGVILATMSAVSAFLALPLFPVWGIILVGVNAFVIWALVSRRRDVPAY